MELDLTASPLLHSRKLAESDLDQIAREILERDKFPIEETEIRNCLIVGRCRTGKTTACGVLMLG